MEIESRAEHGTEARKNRSPAVAAVAVERGERRQRNRSSLSVYLLPQLLLFVFELLFVLLLKLLRELFEMFPEG